jgi:hypothetical protein
VNTLEAVVLKQCVASHDFVGVAATDLPLRKGDVLDVLDVRCNNFLKLLFLICVFFFFFFSFFLSQDSLPWWLGVNLTTGKRGYFPNNHCVVRDPATVKAAAVVDNKPTPFIDQPSNNTNSCYCFSSTERLLYNHRQQAQVILQHRVSAENRRRRRRRARKRH